MDSRVDALRSTVAAARRLQFGQPDRQALSGRHLALLAPADAAHDPGGMQQAALELGARVAQVRHWHEGGLGDAQVLQLGRTLGRMYDAIDCAELPPPLLERLRRAAGVPVFDGLDAQSHPLRALADLMTLQDHPLARRREGLAPVVLRLAGPARRGARGQAFAQGAEALGFVLQDGAPAGLHASAPDFIVEAAPWRLLAADGRSDPALDDSRRAACHRALVQAVLVRAIGPG